MGGGKKKEKRGGRGVGGGKEKDDRKTRTAKGCKRRERDEQEWQERVLQQKQAEQNEAMRQAKKMVWEERRAKLREEEEMEMKRQIEQKQVHGEEIDNGGRREGETRTRGVEERIG